MPKAKPSTRAYEHAQLSLGLINIPVSVFVGTVSSHGISRSMFTTVETEEGTEDHPVGYATIDKVTEKIVDRADVHKKVSTEYGYVFVEDDEVEKLLDLEPKSIKIKSFQPQHLFYQGNYVPKSLYYIEASKMTQGRKKVANKTAEQALEMLLTAMRKEGSIAVVEFTTRGTPKPAVLLPNGTLWVVYFTEELREQRPLPNIDLSPAVVEQARMLIKAQWSEKPTDLEDRVTALIQNYADEKAQAGDFSKPETVEPVAEPEQSGDDLLALLQASVQQAG